MEKKINVNALLMAAFGIVIYVIAGFIINAIIANYLGEAALYGASMGNRLIGFWLALILGVALILPILGGSTKTVYIVAACIELLGMMAAFLFPFQAARIMTPDPERISYIVAGMRYSIIYILLGSAVVIPFCVLTKNKGVLFRSIVLAAAGAFAVALTCVFTIGLRSGISGNALGFLQPICVFLTVEALSNLPIQTEAAKTADTKKATYSYLEQYKQQRKKGEN